jgi:hypothetical protein
MIKLALLFFVFIPSAFGATKSFELYSKGKIVESLNASKKELSEQQFNAQALNSQYQRLISAYRNHIQVRDTTFIEVLKLIEAQKESHKVEVHLPTLIQEAQHLKEAQFTVKQAYNHLDSIIRQGKDTSIISNDRVRLAKILMLRMWSLRQSKVGSAEKKAEWLFLAGKAGHYHFNSGNNELTHYLKLCEFLGKSSACTHISAAQSMLDLGKSIESPKEH